MITIDQLEVLLRSIPQYFLFGGLALFLYSWIEKKTKIALWGEVIFLIIGIIALITMFSGMIPSPKTEGLVQEHVEMVIKMLVMLAINGLFSAISIVVRIIRKKPWNPLVLVVFGLSLYLFFSTTRLAKIPFQLNVPPATEQTK